MAVEGWIALTTGTLNLLAVMTVHAEGGLQDPPLHPGQHLARCSAGAQRHRHHTTTLWQDHSLPPCAGDRAVENQPVPQAAQRMWGEQITQANPILIEYLLLQSHGELLKVMIIIIINAFLMH